MITSSAQEQQKVDKRDVSLQHANMLKYRNVSTSLQRGMDAGADSIWEQRMTAGAFRESDYRESSI